MIVEDISVLGVQVSEEEYELGGFDLVGMISKESGRIIIDDSKSDNSISIIGPRMRANVWERVMIKERSRVNYRRKSVPRMSGCQYIAMISAKVQQISNVEL